MSNKNILLTWHSFNHGFMVTANALLKLIKDKNIQINRVLYLHDKDLSELNLQEKNTFFKLKIQNNNISTQKEKISKIKRIRDNYQLESESFPSIEQKRLHIKNVTDYQSIYDNLISYIQSIEFNDTENLHINVSPGTPQMHVVWLMLNASGFLPKNTQLWTTQYDKRKGETTLHKINFKPQRHLNEILKNKYLNSKESICIPEKTNSSLRKEAENKINIYAKNNNIPLLLLGERGTGKSTYITRLVKDIPGQTIYKELACGTFDESLMKSQLFGHVKGAFTGALEDKRGILDEVSDGGVLFLDEIQDLSKTLQRQLMQVLQTGEYYPVGSSNKKKARFRLFTASNKNFDELYEKYLDLDFLDRVAKFVVEIPPLRNTREDLESIWNETWKNMIENNDGAEFYKKTKLKSFLSKHSLPGNFRDIQKLVSLVNAFYSATNNKNQAVNESIMEFQKWTPKASRQKKQFEVGKTYNHIISHFNKELADWAVKEYGSVKKASSILEISESSLHKYKKMERLKK